MEVQNQNPPGGSPPNCKGDHGLNSFKTPVGGYQCNSCNMKQRRKTEMFGCLSCNYYLCVVCYQRLFTVSISMQNQNQNQNQYHQQGTTAIHDIEVNEICLKCDGNGFIHDSSIDHKKPIDQKCFFCKDCFGCQGKGYIKGKKKIITANSGIFGISTISQVSSINKCPPCKGLGFTHTSSLSHSRPPNVQCIFCKTCKACNGSGRI